MIIYMMLWVAGVAALLVCCLTVAVIYSQLAAPKKQHEPDSEAEREQRFRQILNDPALQAPKDWP
jgi:hypothetical protein